LAGEHHPAFLTLYAPTVREDHRREK